MDTINNNEHQSNSEFNLLKADPVITYDHMSENVKNRYFGIKNTVSLNTILHLLLEETLIAGLIALAVITCL